MQENITEAYECFKRVEPQWEQLPQVRIRLAGCYQKMNQPDQAQAELQTIMKTARVPAHIKVKAKEVLAQLEQRYPHMQAAALVA